MSDTFDNQHVLDEVADIIARMGEADRTISDLESAEKDAITAAKAVTVRASKKPKRILRQGWQRLNEIDALYGELLFAQQKSVNLPSGQFGRQRTTEAIVTGKTALVVRRLLRLDRSDLVTEKYSITVDKNAVKKDENLPVVVGIRGITVVDFRHIWVKPSGRKERINDRKKKIGIRRKK